MSRALIGNSSTNRWGMPANGWTSGKTRRSGVILDGRVALSDRLELHAGYSYIDAGMRGGELQGRDLTFIADHSGGVGASYRFSEAFSGYVEMTAVSEREYGGDFTNAFGARITGMCDSGISLAPEGAAIPGQYGTLPGGAPAPCQCRRRCRASRRSQRCSG